MKNTLVFFLLLFLSSVSNAQNFSNKGKEFWVGYGHNFMFENGSSNVNGQDMILYLSAEQPAVVKVSIANTSWTRTYNVPANTVITSDAVPKSGADDCRILSEGKSNRAIHIESDVPIVAYSHVFGAKTSGATMLVPVEGFGYTYYSLNTEQAFDTAQKSHSWFYVIANEENTRVKITPSKNSIGGKLQGVPFEVDLNKGEIFNLMGGTLSGFYGLDLSGSKIESVSGSDGKCHPIALFSGSSRTFICIPSTPLGGGDFIMQQIIPASAWGVRYLTAPTSTSLGPSVLNTNKYRVYVRDPLTKVYRNGLLLYPLYFNSYYEFPSNTADFITADNPITVAQLIVSGEACGSIGEGDPEMILLSPIEQAIKKVTFYNTDKESINHNYLTLIIPASGLSSLKIDGDNYFDTAYAHPALAGYYVVIKQLPVKASQHTVESDVAFTAITYGLGIQESYGYNAGTYIDNLTTISELKNKFADTTGTYTCSKTPFRVLLKTIYPLTAINWHFSAVPGLAPSADETVNGPITLRTELINNRSYYVYESPVDLKFSQSGEYNIPVTITSGLIDNCGHTEEVVAGVRVDPAPGIDFNTVSVCANDSVVFSEATASLADSWTWNFGDGTGSNIAQPKKAYATHGSFTVNLQTIRAVDGCVGDTSKLVKVHAIPVAAFDLPQVVCMPGGTAVFVNKSTVAGDAASTLSNAWDYGDGQTNTLPEGKIGYRMAGSYDVTLITSSQPGCSDTITKTISNFQSLQAVVAAADTALCPGAPFKFADQTVFPGNAGLVSRQWSFGDGTTSASSTPTKIYQKSGNYTVELRVTGNNGCTDVQTAAIIVLAAPIVDAGPDIMVESGRKVTLKGTVSDPSAKFQWSPAGSLSSTLTLEPVVTATSNQQYFLNASGLNGCTGTDSMWLKIFTGLRVPNAFTPNNDGLNDTWIIPALQSNTTAIVQIYNRYGQIVYRSVGYGRPWDGRYNGKDLSPGAYQYIISMKDTRYGVTTGQVMLIR